MSRGTGGRVPREEPALGLSRGRSQSGSRRRGRWGRHWRWQRWGCPRRESLPNLSSLAPQVLSRRETDMAVVRIIELCKCSGQPLPEIAGIGEKARSPEQLGEPVLWGHRLGHHQQPLPTVPSCKMKAWGRARRHHHWPRPGVSRD